MLCMYLDKIKLSSFRTQKGYSWIVSLCNLNSTVGTRIESETPAIVGWLLVVHITKSVSNMFYSLRILC